MFFSFIIKQYILKLRYKYTHTIFRKEKKNIKSEFAYLNIIVKKFLGAAKVLAWPIILGLFISHVIYFLIQNFNLYIKSNNIRRKSITLNSKNSGKFSI